MTPTLKGRKNKEQGVLNIDAPSLLFDFISSIKKFFLKLKINPVVKSNKLN